MANQNIPAGTTQNQPIQLNEFAQNLQVNGQLVADANQPAVRVSNTLNRINVANSGLIRGDATAVQIDGVGATIRNNGTIDGKTNAIDIVNGDTASATIQNYGTLTSASRAVNIGGVGGSVFNAGNIITTADPKNGTIYGDRTAKNQVIDNRGRIDVGAGLNGDALSLELGANVNGAVTNSGVIQGRGVAKGPLNNKNNQSSAVRLYANETSSASVFNGNITNSGYLAAENGAAVIVEDKTRLNGEIVNSGTIQGGKTATGTLAIDVSLADGDSTIRNSGQIIGDVLLGAGNDRFDGSGGKINGTVDGGDGNDILMGGRSHDRLLGGAGNDTLDGKQGDDFLNGGTGVDTLTGGRGSDTFFLSRVAGTPTTAPNGISVINQPDILTDYQIGRDKLSFDDADLGITGGIKFQNGASAILGGDNNLLVLQDGFANAAAAAKAIADNENITAGAGAFVYYNTTLGFARLVASDNLSNGGSINVLGNLTNVTDPNALATISANDFAIV
jgi:Ca2+-binding RTX toxin-like protein